MIRPDIIALAAGHDPDLAGLLDAMLTSFELAAVSHATVPGYVHEALAACRDSGRTSAVIGPQSPKAVRGYLEGHGETLRPDRLCRHTRQPPAWASHDLGSRSRKSPQRTGSHACRMCADHRLVPRHRNSLRGRRPAHRVRPHARRPRAPGRHWSYLHHPEPRRPHAQTPRQAIAELSRTRSRRRLAAPLALASPCRALPLRGPPGTRQGHPPAGSQIKVPLIITQAAWPRRPVLLVAPNCPGSRPPLLKVALWASLRAGFAALTRRSPHKGGSAPPRKEGQWDSEPGLPSMRCGWLLDSASDLCQDPP